jgi:PAS domain S-box-containing protein
MIDRDRKNTCSAWVIAVSAALLVQGGLIGALLAQLRRRRLAERSLRESEERQSLAMESAKVGFWSLEKSSGRCWTPLPTLKLWGLDSAINLDLEGFLAVVHPEDRGMMRQTLQRGLSVAQQTRVEFRVVLPDGSVRWFLSLGRSQVNAKGEITGLTGVSIHITNRKLAEEALHREKALTDAVFDSVPGLLYLYTKEGRMVRWNKKHEDLTGYSGRELSHMTMTDWFSEEDWASVKSEWEKVFANGHTNTEVNVKLKDGTKVPYLATGVRLQIEGKPHLVGIAIDITEQKRLELESKRHFQELAHVSRVAVMGELTASLAHELNQPLGAILHNAETAEILLRADQPDQEEVRAILADIRKDGHRAGDVIDRLRGLLKRRNLQSMSLEVGALIADTVSLVRPDAGARHMSVSVDVPPGLPQVIGDRVHLQQVLLNLVMNAIDAVDERPDAERRILVAAQMAGKGMLEVSVRDSGGGIHPADMTKLFDSFFTSKAHGLGLGLSISRTIIEAHGGRIWAENKSDGGATFRFTLPIATASQTQ